MVAVYYNVDTGDTSVLCGVVMPFYKRTENR